MSLDPDAVRRIRARELLEQVEVLCDRIDSTHSEVSMAVRSRIAALKCRLCWCDGCYSLRRRQLLLDWVIRGIAELILRMVETLFCIHGAAARRNRYDARPNHPLPKTGSWAFADSPCEGRGRFRIVSVPGGNGQTGGKYPAPSESCRQTRHAGFPFFRSSPCGAAAGPVGPPGGKPAGRTRNPCRCARLAPGVGVQREGVSLARIGRFLERGLEVAREARGRKSSSLSLLLAAQARRHEATGS